MKNNLIHKFNILQINYFNLIILLLAFTIGFIVQTNAQEFKWKSEISGVNQDGFNKIILAPSIVSKLNHQLGDIRLYDSENNEIPYIFQSDAALTYSDYFSEYKIVEKKEQTSWPYYTRIVIHNPAKSQLSNIHLLIKNSDVSKSLKLSGSDDNKNWYIIKDNYRFQALYSDVESSVIKIIDFPVSNYEYYEILIDDWRNNPISILKVGFFNTSVEKGKYTELENPEISQLELKEGKQSLIKVQFNGPQLINKINFKIEGPEYYYRKAEIQVRDSALDKRNKYNYFFKTIDDVSISSSNTNTFYFEQLWAESLFIRVYNQDDQALTFKYVVAEQLNRYLVCQLKKSKNYLLKYGNAKISNPVYDLNYFIDKIPKTIPQLTTGEIVSIGATPETNSKGIHLDNQFIWIAIIAVGVLLVYMVFQMLKEMKKKDTQ